MAMKNRAWLFVSGVMALTSLAGLLWATDIWKSKPVSEWTREETQLFFKASPWERQVVVGGGGVDMSSPVGPAGERMDSHETSGATERAGPSASESGPEMDTGGGGTPFFIEWSSARIVREAAAHMRALHDGGKAPALDMPVMEVYAITVAGPNLNSFGKVEVPQIKADSYLKPKHSKEKINAVDVRIVKRPDNRIVQVQFIFPRTIGNQPVLADDDKSVEFNCRVKDLNLHTTFDLNRMATAQGRDL
jgi:hypothetical protein